VRFVTDDTIPTHLSGWIKNTLKKQGCIMVEPYYEKIRDFGMEFYSDGEGVVSYKGLSLFDVEKGAYTGNVLATESFKKSIISRYVSVKLLEDIKERICKATGLLYAGKYKGYFGVDMMIVAGEKSEEYLLHPCVEVNLRRTMGHIALAMSPSDDDKKMLMIIIKNKNYQLKIQTL